MRAAHTRRAHWLILAICVLALAAALRFHNLGRASFWYDEGNSWVQATRNPLAIAEHSARDIHPPGYYWLLAGARQFFGDSEFALRAPSALLSVLAAACLIAAGRWLGSGQAGRLAALLFAANSFALDYAQQARMYALHTLWGAALLLATLSWWRRPRRGRLLLLAIINAAGLWTHYSFVFVILAQGCVLILLAGREWRRWLRRFGALYSLTALLYLPWLPQAIGSITHWPNTGEAISTTTTLRELLRWFAVGRSGEFSPAFALLIGISVGVAVLAGAIDWRRERGPAGSLSLWALLPVALFLLLGLFRPANLKFLLPAQAAFTLWLGWGFTCWWRWRRWLAPVMIAPLLVGLALGTAEFYENAPYQRADYRAALARIQAESQANPNTPAAIIFNGPGQVEVFAYYDAQLSPPLSSLLTIHPVPGGSDGRKTRFTRAILSESERIYVLFWGEGERDPNGVVEQTLAAAGHFLDATWYGDLRLARYHAPLISSVIHWQPARFQNPRNGDSLQLLGYHLPAQEKWAAGEWLSLELHWQATSTYQSRYRIFAQLLYLDGRLAVTHDSEPGGNLQPTTNWNDGELAIDRHALSLPADLPPGEYQLIVGAYPIGRPNERLQVGGNGGDYLSLGTITVTEQ